MTTIIADDREDLKRLAFAQEFFESLGYTFKISHNEIGDYVLYKNDKPKVAVEYKTAPDFISSIVDKRVFNQARDIAENFPKHFIYIEGYLWQYIASNRHHYKNTVINQIEGALSSIRQLTTPVECLNQQHCFQRMHQDFQKSTDGKNRQLTAFNKDHDTMITFLRCIKDVDYVKATTICRELKLRCLDDLLSLNIDRLTLVEGIGEITATKIMAKIEKPLKQVTFV